MKLESLQDLFVEELADLYDAEKRLVKALPKMVASANHPKLKTALQDHLRETEDHVSRLDSIFDRLDHKRPSQTCEGMKGLIEEGSEMCQYSGDPAVIDAGLICAAQKVEHYEIAGYGCARTYAEMLGDHEAAAALDTTLDEEKAADQKLNELAMAVINVKAANV